MSSFVLLRSGSGKRRVVLAGCGHAHLEVVRRASEFHARGVEHVLVDPGLFWYSGLGGGVLGGRFGEADAVIDPERLAAARSAIHVRGRIVGIDRMAREVLLQSGQRLGYDLLSLNIGSHVPIPSGLAGAIAAKPLGSLPALRDRIAANGGRVLVIGGGATGCELAGNLLHLRDARGLDLSVTLVTAGAELIEAAPRGLRQRALASLRGRGADVRLSQTVCHSEEGAVRLSSGETIGVDHLVLATGLAASPMVETLGLPFRSAGLRVGQTLASIGDDRVFAAGDCAAIEGYDLPKIGVYGVRAGPVLARNLLAALDGRPLERFRPQRRFLSVLDLADGEGLAMRGGYWTAGRLALRLKSYLDRSFVERYRRLYA